MNNEKILRRKIERYLMTPIFVSVFLISMCITLFFVSKEAGHISLIFVGLFIVIEIIIYIVAKTGVLPVLMGFALEQGQIQKELLKDLAIPYALLDIDGKILWGNRKFVEVMGEGSKKKIRRNIDYFFPVLADEALAEKEQTFRLTYDGRLYDALIKRIEFEDIFEDEDSVVDPQGETLLAVFLFDVTELDRCKREIEDEKLVAGLLYIDNYAEVMENTEEVRHSLVEALVDRRINMYLSTFDAIGKKTEKDKYLFVFKQKYLDQLQDTKFAILDEIKNINVGNEIPITLSIGLGSNADSFADAYESARIAIGLALGRGGDQAVLRNGDKVFYFGGKSAGTEKSTRVKARVKAQSFSELLNDKEHVLIMGHKRPDADAFGSAVGVYRLVKTLGKTPHIVLDEATDAIRPIVDCFKNDNAYEEDMIITREMAMSMTSPKTLVVVVDVNKPSMTECSDLLNMTSSVVVFDHHRQAEEKIDNALLSYIEPYASSACEMVAEMLQYIDEKVKIRPLEADAMYAGIVIDTDGFVTKTGVRTFEAASYLKRNGADVVRVRKLFRNDMTSFKQQAEGVLAAEMFMDSFAISQVDAEASDSPTVLAAKVANELLDVDGVRASFVLTKVGDTVFVSARSVDDVNVQVITERMGGGGHANVAGVQFTNATVEEIIEKIKFLLTDMYQQGDL